MQKTGPVIVGAGALGGAVAKGLKLAGYDVVIADPSEKVRSDFEQLGVRTYADPAEALRENFGPVMIALKPYLMVPMAKEWASLLKGRACCSLAAVIEIDMLRKAAPEAYWGRAMTNIASAVGRGFTGVTPGDWQDADQKSMMEFFGSFSEAIVVAEPDIDGVIALSGSAIAFVFMLMEAFMQGGLLVGLRSDVSLKAAIATLKGASSLVEYSGEHPAALKDKVCTPGGMTIQGLRVLEEGKFKSDFMEAMVRCYEVGKSSTAAMKEKINEGS